ncbi:recombinase RecT [Priestia megaterium]|uniref:recombinase RecT n=1 Tax=Priestia megaterium TaxID=1404 RepID=UPI002E1DE010|nr:recombinase RecT [Priestia megaterium]MED3865230.1 recombinase RecT [Priestia megaterium]MED4102135.1 recombinase RecT [Priestia megaterium]MED4142642.1 recombinase RecT [Priestia megaterium]
MSNINTANTVNKLQAAAKRIPANSPDPQNNPGKVSRNLFSDFMRSQQVEASISNVLAETGRKEQFISSVISLWSENKDLQEADRGSVLQACMKAAVLDLPIDKNLGFAWVIAYKGKAQCQLGYKAFIQFALRTGKYHKINAIPIYEGQLRGFNYLTEEYDLDFSNKESNNVIGYMGYYKLLDGFEKTVYWSKADIEKHRDKFSKQAGGFGWKDNFDAMALKTVIKSMLNKWGLLTTQLQNDLKVAEEAERFDITDQATEIPQQQLTQAQ